MSLDSLHSILGKTFLEWEKIGHIGYADKLYENLISAGWLPPCRGRIIEEKVYDGISPYMNIPIRMNPDGVSCRIRLILDPLEEEEK